eukprot:m.336035 g.336035  ORF g.336035 m.336035 type:complete len:585 (+) comp17739_c0_seq1:140-1894(+)
MASKQPKVFTRSATVSSAAPLKHKDKLTRQLISRERREKFEALDLETLLSEFRAVAAHKEENPPNGEDEENGEVAQKGETSTADALRWLRSSGLGALADLHEQGKLISDSHVEELVDGYLPAQIESIQRRVSVLNRILRGKNSVEGAEAENELLSPTIVNKDGGARMSVLSRQDEEDPPILFEYLGDTDQQQVQKLVLISLTSMLESSGLTIKLGKPPRKKKRKKTDVLFGVNLVNLVESDLEERPEKVGNDKNIPIFLESVIKFLREKGLNEEGIFRKAGSAARIKELRSACEAKQGLIDFVEHKARPHDVAALLKQFLRDTPEPLLTSQYLDTFSLTPQLKDPQMQVDALGLVSILLPPVHQSCLRFLLEFLADVADNVEKNKMGISNLAVVFAPSLFFVRGQKGQKMLKEVEMQVTTANALKLLITHYKTLWSVPPEIIGQHRFINEQGRNGKRISTKKGVEKLLKEGMKGGKDSKPEATQSKSAHVTWIKDSKANPPIVATVVIQLPHNSSKSVNIHSHTTSLDVLGSCRYTDGYVLAERGGNLGERRLDMRTRIVPLLQVNPDGGLVVVKTDVTVGLLI